MQEDKKDRRILLLQVVNMLKNRGQLHPDAHPTFERLGPKYTFTPGSVKPGESPRLFVMPSGSALVYDEHGATVYRPNGSITLMRKDHSIEMTNPGLDRIEVDDLMQVQSHEITRLFQTTSHVMDFLDGGTFSFVTDATGTVIEALLRGVAFRYRGEERVLRVYGSLSRFGSTD